MDRASTEFSDDAVVGQRDLNSRRIVREHGDDRLTSAGVRDAGRLVCTQLEERAALFGIAVEDGDIVSSLHQIRRHRRSHLPEAYKSNFHSEIS
jgi:hypothetical protein